MNPHGGSHSTPAALHSSFEVITARRTVPSSHSPLVPVPPKETIRDVEGYVSDCLHVYTRDWKLVKFNGEEERRGSLSPRGMGQQGMSMQDMMGGGGGGGGSSSSERLLDFSKPDVREQTGVFTVYRPKTSSEKSIGRIYSIESPFQEKSSTIVSVELREVRLSSAVLGSSGSEKEKKEGTPRGSSIRDGPAPVNEPLFSTITLVDIKQKERRSESFFFIHHPETVGDMVVLNPPIPMPEQQQQQQQQHHDNRSSFMAGSGGGGGTPLSMKDKSISLGNLNYNPNSPSTSPLSAKKPPPARAPPATPTRMATVTGGVLQPEPSPILLPGMGKPGSSEVPPLALKNLMPGQAPSRRAGNASSDNIPGVPSSGTATRPHCLFSVEDPHPGIYIVIRVGRLLRETEKGKESELSIKELEELCNTPLHSKFIQFMAWGAVPLFLDSSHSTIGMATSGGNPVGSTGGMKWHSGKEDMPCTLYSISQPFSDELIFQLLTNDRELKRQKPLPSECYVSLRRFADDARGRVLEMQSFFPKQSAILHHVNLLYFYPTNLKIPKLKNPNIVIRIRLKDDDSDPNAEGLVSFYTRGSLIPNEGSAYSSVSFHEKAPFFTDEFKLQLPINLNKRHHLVISYHNVTPRRDTSQILGYSIVPLLKSNRILKDGDLVSGITVQLPQNYLRPDAQIKYLDSKKAFLHYRVRTYSSIHPQDDKLQDFFLHHNSDSTAPIVVGLRQANPAIVMNFFPVIFDQLLRIISNASESTAKEAFLTLLSILPSPSNNQLISYVEYLFDNPKPSAKFVHEEICRLWVAYLSDEKPHPIVERFPNNLNWFLLMVMRKSMMMSTREKATYPPDFQKNLSRLLGLLVQGNRCSALDQALSVAMFLKDMLYVLDSAIVYDLIDTCVSGFQRQENNPMSELLKLTFIRVVTEHDGYLTLMLPESTKEIKNLGDVFKKQHYLTSLLLNEVQGSLTSGDAGRRRQAVETFRDILRKHALDRRYQTAQAKQRIAALYFPILTSITENFMILKPVLESQSEEPNSWLITVIHLVKDCDKALLRAWWTSKPQKIHLAFLALLDYALSVPFDNAVTTLSSFVVLDIVQSFIYDYNGLEGDQEVNPLVEKFFDLLQKMMLSTNESFLLSIFATLEKIVQAYGRIIFSVPNTPFCEKLCFDVLRHCKSSIPGIRSHASKFFYSLIKINQKEVGNISRMKLQSTVAIAKLVGMDQSKHDAAFFISLENSLKEIGDNATQDGPKSSIAIDAVQLTNNLMAIVRESKKISENSQDPEMVEDLYYTVSRSYVHSPDLRVAWLESLAVIHESNKSWVEAAQCKIFIASLVFQYHRKAASNQMFRRTNLEDISEIAPNIPREPELSEEARAEGSEAFQSEVWTIAGFFDLLKEASNLLEQAELYELSIQIYELIAPVHRMDKNFTEMHVCYQKMQELCNKLIETEKKAKERLFPSYFRVAFYGEKFGEMNGKEFVYKEKPRTVLGNITERIKMQLSTKYPSVPIVVLPNSKDLPALKSDTLYIQIANVRTYDDPLEERVTEFDRHFNIKRFIFEMGFTTEGKGQSDDLSKQQKKKIIFNTQYSFPDIKKRQVVTHKEEIILTPIENALELINDKIRAIREILEISPPNKNKLQQLLTGTVMTMVNAGPVALCESFLAKEHVTKFSLVHVKEMRQRMDYFVLLCAFAVKLHKGVVGTEQQELHKQYETKFEVLKSKIKQFTSLPLVESAFAPEKAPAPTKTTIVTPPLPSVVVLPQLTTTPAQPAEGFEQASSSSTEKPTTITFGQNSGGSGDSSARILLKGLASGTEVPLDLDRKVRNSTMRVKERRNTGAFSPTMYLMGAEDTSSSTPYENAEHSSLSEIAASLAVPSLSSYLHGTGGGEVGGLGAEQQQQRNRSSQFRVVSPGLSPPPVAPPRKVGSGVFGGSGTPPSS